MNNSIRRVGHRACNVWTEIQDVRVATHLQACLELRSDSGIYRSFPETLWSVPIGAWAYETHCVLLWRARPGMQPPSLVVAHIGRARCHSQDHSLGRAQDWVSRRWQRDLPGKATSCQPKHKSLKMLKVEKTHTQHLSNIFSLKTKTKKSLCFLSSLWRHRMKRVLDSLRS